MSERVRIVTDTSLLVAGALRDGYARDFLLKRNLTVPDYELFLSEAILLELQTKLEGMGLSRPTVVEYVKALSAVANVVRPTVRVQVVRDPDDDMVVECALEARAQLIIAFDKDIIALKEYRGIQIGHPSMLKYWFHRK